MYPKREDLTSLYQLRETLGEYNFAGQYQQNPAPKEGGVIKKEWLKYYNPKELFDAVKRGEIEIRCIMQSWDTAGKIEEHNDYSVCVTILRDTDDTNYVLNVYREKLEFPDLVKTIIHKYKFAKEEYRHKIDVLIEDKSSGISLIQTLKSNCDIYAKGIKPEYDKKTRLMAVSHLIENGKCLFPSDNPSWWLDFEYELLRFPKAKNDDQCDALSQALNYKAKRINIEFL